MKLPRITWKRALIALGVLLLAVGVGFVLWGLSAPEPMPEARAALQDDDRVDVSQEGWIAFAPRDTTPQAGFILYPGGRVPAEAYAPLARAIAEEGYYAAVVYAPLNFAFLDAGAAGRVIDANPEVPAWVVSGHSLGGVVAAGYAAGADDTVRGLVLMASFPADDSLAQRDDLLVVSIYGTLDGLARPQDIQNTAGRLPEDTEFLPIEGGNHAQFGWYGPQARDNEATISREEQQAQIAAAVLDVLAQIAPE